MNCLFQQVRTYATAAWVVGILCVGDIAGVHAKQTSLDARIIQAFESIDERTDVHERDVTSMRQKLDAVAADLTDLRATLASLPKQDVSAETRKLRRVLHGKMINKSAEYLNQSYKLVDSAAAVISANLSDLTQLSNALRHSPGASKNAHKIKERVQKNIAAGKSMRLALHKLRGWAASNPELVGRFQSMRRLAQALDRRVSIDRARLKSRNVDATGSVRTRRQDALDRTVDRLGDMYVEVEAEKDALRDLRDELSIAIQLGRMEMTQEVAERAIPRIDGIRGPTMGIESLQDMAAAIGDLNSSLIVEAELPVSIDPTLQTVTPGPGYPKKLKIGEFKNF